MKKIISLIGITAFIGFLISSCDMNLYPEDRYNEKNVELNEDDSDQQYTTWIMHTVEV